MMKEQFSVPLPSSFLPLSGLFQLGYTATDVDQAMREIAGTYGISKFRVSRGVKSLPGMPEMTLDQAHAFVGALQIEVNVPTGGDDGIYREFLPTEGFAIRFHHYGMMVDRAEEVDHIVATLRAKNIPLGFDASIPNVARAIYVDVRASLGHYLEYVYQAPEMRSKYYADVPHN
jgi:hypothetical protein